MNLGFMAGPVAHDHRDPDAQRRLVAQRFDGMRGEVPKLIEGVGILLRRDGADHAGLLVAWAGDAARRTGYCASPPYGQGTGLALMGAYPVAAELAAEDPGGPASEESVERAKRAISLDE